MITILDSVHPNQSFSIGERMVTLSPDMALADAETIDQQYPGVYLTITPTDQPEQSVASSDKAKGGKTADKTETTN